MEAIYEAGTASQGEAGVGRTEREALKSPGWRLNPTFVGCLVHEGGISLFVAGMSDTSGAARAGAPRSLVVFPARDFPPQPWAERTVPLTTNPTRRCRR